jgi:hypothetical protein
VHLAASIGLACALAGQGCAPTGDEAGETAASESIIGGMRDRGAHPAVGTLRWGRELDAQGRPTSPPSSCTVTLIAPQWILTAAHCVHPNARYHEVSFGEEPGYRARVGGYNGWIPVTLIRSDDYIPNVTVGDVAVGRLAWSPGITPIARGAEPARDSFVTAVGYGVSAYDLFQSTGRGVRRAVDVRVVFTGNWLETRNNDGSGARGVCYGDAGGPLLANNRIVGVASAVTVYNCSGRALSANVNLELGFIRRYVPTF